jgi:hypothetical protein
MCSLDGGGGGGGGGGWLDKERVQRVVVYEMSKGSKYFENEERKEAFAGQKIESINVRSSHQPIYLTIR